MREGRSRGPCGTTFGRRFGATSIEFRLLPCSSQLRIRRLRGDSLTPPSPPLTPIFGKAYPFEKVDSSAEMGSWRVPKTRHDHSSTEGPQDRAGGSYCASGGPGVESRTVSRFKDRTALVTEASLLLAVLFLGTNPVAVKVAVSEVPALPFVATRFTLAGLVLLVIVLLVGLERPGGRDLLSMAGIGLLGVGMNNVCFTFGVSMTTASDTALIYAAVPIWGILLGLALGLERPTRWGVVGMALAFLGVGVVVYGGLGGGGGTSIVGDLLVVVATMCWGSYAVLSLPLLRSYSALVVAGYTMLFGGLAALLLAVPGLLDVDWEAVSREAWGAVAYSTLLVAAFGFAAWQAGISRIGANRVLVYQYLITLVGVTAGVLLLGESLTINKILGGAVILLGVYLARRR